MKKSNNEVRDMLKAFEEKRRDAKKKAVNLVKKTTLK